MSVKLDPPQGGYRRYSNACSLCGSISYLLIFILFILCNQTGQSFIPALETEDLCDLGQITLNPTLQSIE